MATFNAAEADTQISVVIPTYNREELITRAIMSAANQSRRPFEIIVVDDGSTDSTRQAVAELGDLVSYVYQDNKGSAAARNRGVWEAGSDWVAFLDSDDMWVDAHLERMAKAIHATAGIASFYFSDTVRPAVQGGQRQWQLCDFDIEGDYQLIKDATKLVLWGRQPMMLQSSVFKRADYLKSNGLWERLQTREDTHFFLKLGIGGVACAVTKCGALMTADDGDGRLTFKQGRHSEGGVHAQVLLNRDILRRSTKMSPADKKLLKRRLALASRGLARIYWRQSRPLAATLWAAKSAAIAPALFLEKAAQRIRGATIRRNGDAGATRR